MASVGSIALERLQAGLEATRFTAVAATRKVYAERGNAIWEDVENKEFLAENVGSYIEAYRHVVVGQQGKLTVPVYVSASDLAWWGQLAWKGAVTATGPTNTSVYTYTFTPSPTTDDLKTATFEAYSDTVQIQIPGCFVDQFEITWQGGKTVSATASIVAQQVIVKNVTPSIGDRSAVNAIAGTTAKVYLDTSTIGTTQALNVLSGKITWGNNVNLITHLIGQLYPDDAYRLPRFAEVELDIHYQTDTERLALNADTLRKLRVVLSGPNIASSNPATNETVTMDFYGYWKTMALGSSGAIRTLKVTGQSQYDTTALIDWQVAIANSNATLP